MCKLFVKMLFASVSLIICSCGGAGNPSEGDGLPLLQAGQAISNVSFLSNESASARTTSTEPVAPRRLASAGTDANAAASVFMDWAETQFPKLFPGPQQNQAQAPYVFRYYPSSKNYLGVANGKVYVLGSTTGSALLMVGEVSDFTCQISRENCFGLPQANAATPACLAAAITCIKVMSTSSASQASVPITFGQPFKMGDLPAGSGLEARDASGRSVAVQMDETSTHADGSVRFAVISAQVNDLQPNEQRMVHLFRSTASASSVSSVNTSTFDIKLSANIYSPQVTLVWFGNRDGTTAGIPYVAGEQITMQLGSATSTEQFSLTITADQAGGGFQTLTKIAEAFMQLINTKSKVYRASKFGEGGGYEQLWITTAASDAPGFNVKFTYSGKALQNLRQLQAYSAARKYEVNARAALETLVAARRGKRLDGAVAVEFTITAPFIEVGTGAKHPQLVARLYPRFYDGGSRVRTDMVVENNWAYEPNPGNLTYDLTVTQGNRVIHHLDPFTHNHHARWHKVLWSGDEPQMQVRHYMPYFLASRATWNYDLTLAIPESVLAAEATNLAKADTSPMGAAMLTPAFGTTGGRADIGPLPRWTALYLVTQDPRARASMLANADAAAGVPIHYRDAATDQPLSLDLHPGVAMRFGDSMPKDVLPPVVNNATIWSPDTSHQASFAYIPYLITGDAFYLDEMMFWANWNMGSKNPGYREYARGLINSEQVRGQAWGLRSLGEAARALPDRHPMKSYFTTRLMDNLQWYAALYPPRDPHDTTLSQLGLMERGSTQLHGAAPWQNDFVAIVLAQEVENGQAAARSHLQWLSRFTTGRFAQEAQGFCIAKATAYSLQLFDSQDKQITNWTALSLANWPSIARCDPTMPVDGYPEWAGGYAANARAMLAASANASIDGAFTAYQLLQAKTSKMDADFRKDPTWAIVPRH